MFEFSILPFSTSNTMYFNTEVYDFILQSSFTHEYTSNITKLVEISLNIEQNNTIIL